MDFRPETQGIKRTYVRLVDFIKGLLGLRAPVATVEPAITIAPAQPGEITLAELDAMLAEIADEAAAPAPQPEPIPAPIVAAPRASDPDAEIERLMAELLVETPAQPAPVQPVEHEAPIDLSGMSLEQIVAELDAIAPAKTSTNLDAANPENPQATQASPAHRATVRPVVTLYPLPATPTLHTHPPIWQRLKLAPPSPLHHLFGTPAKPYTRPSFTPSTTWSRSTPTHKTAHAIRQCNVAFTLNLSPAREKALRASDDPAKRLAHEINRAMRTTFGRVLPYHVQLEISPAGRLHAHGTLDLEITTQAQLGRVWQALSIAGGKVQPALRARQVMFKELYYADGWSAYFNKTAPATARLLGTDKIAATSSLLRAKAERHWSTVHPQTFAVAA